MATSPETPRRIVVGTDGSPRSRKAVEWAAEVAVKRQLPLWIVQVVPAQPTIGLMPAAAHGGLPDTEFAEIERQYLTQVRAGVGKLAADLRAVTPGLDVLGTVVAGRPSQVLAEASKDAALVVVGARGQTAPKAVKWLGGVADAVSQHAHGPIAVIPEGAQLNSSGPVVVGVDRSPEARLAVAVAFQEAALRGLSVMVIYAFNLAAAEDAWDATTWDPDGVQLTQALTAMVRDVTVDAEQQHPDVPVEIRIERGRPQEVLVEASRNAAVVVVGSRGRGGFRGLLLGSTSKHVLRESHSPVIVSRG